MKYLTAILLFVSALTTTAAAQQGQGAGAKVYTEIVTGSPTAVVKGEPFSAEAISDSVQTLADGNRITRSNTVRMFRDSEGRSRREGSSSTDNGSITTSVATAQGFDFAFSGFGFQETISIFDPVSNLRYSLNPTAKTARRMKTQFRMASGTLFGTAQSITPAVKAQIETNAAKSSQLVLLPSLAPISIGGNGSRRAGKTESLGTRDIEGVMAEGTRSVTTIPAGAIGNERPIEIVYERWYSKELQLIIYSRHTDPRFGEQTYRLTNVSRSEPERSLFMPPNDYKIVSEGSFNIFTPRPQ